MLTFAIAWLLVLGFCNALDLEETGETTKDVFEKSVEIFEAIADNDLIETSKGIAKWAMPLMSAIGNFAKVLLSQVESESEELKFMKDQFKIINDKMDYVDKNFEEVKLLLDWNVIKIQYGKYERIADLLQQFIDFIQEAPPSIRQFEVQKFLMNYDILYEDAAINIFSGFVNQNMIFSDNLIVAIRKFTKDHRYKIDKFFMGNLKLILKCLEIETFYMNFKNFSDIESIWRTKWEERLNNLTNLMKQVGEQVTERWSHQYRTDLEEFSVENSQLSHKYYGEKLYFFLTDKYRNRKWQVIVYDPLESDNDHAYKICNGSEQISQKGHNILVSNLPLNSRPFRKDLIEKICQDIPHKLSFRTYGPALQLLRIFIEKRIDCVYSNQIAAVIRSKSDKYYIGPDGHVFSCRWSGYYNKVINIHKTLDIIIMG